MVASLKHFFLTAVFVTSSTCAAPLVFQDTFDSENHGVSTNVLNYSGFRSWNVSQGTVDLLSSGSCAGQGLCVDLDGSTRQGGVLVTKGTFPGGDYRLSFDMSGGAGNPPMDINSVRLSLGSGYSEQFTAAAGQTSAAPFQTVTRAFFLNTTTRSPLTIGNVGSSDNGGIFLDNVHLENITRFADVIHNSVNVTPIGPTLFASFQPNYGMTLEEAATIGGYDHFNWLQVKRRAPDPTLALRTPYIDPPIGGADLSWAPLSPQWADDRPFYWDETSPPFFNARPWSVGYLLDNNKSDSELRFQDTPSDPYAGASSTIDFVTLLVGVKTAMNWDILDLTSWSSTGSSISVHSRAIDIPPDISGRVISTQRISIADLSAAELDLLRLAGAQNLPSIGSVPEPGAAALVFLGLAALSLFRKQRREQRGQG